MARRKKKARRAKASADKSSAVVNNVVSVNVASDGGNEADKALRKLKTGKV